MQSINIYGSKKRAMIFVICGIICALLGLVLFLSMEGRDRVFTLQLSLFLIVSLAAPALVIYGLIVFVKSPLLLIIDENGICIRPRKKQYIDWDSIEDFSEKKRIGGQMILIHVKDPHKLVAEETSKLYKRIMENNLSTIGTPFFLPSKTYTMSHKEVLELLEKRLADHKSRS